MREATKFLAPAAVVLLLIAFSGAPLGYYTFLRIAITIIAVVCALALYGENFTWIIFAGIGVLYNPIIRVFLSRETWEPINLLTAVAFAGVALWAWLSD